MNTTIDRPACISKNRFDPPGRIAAPFLQQPGLPFADVLSAETLRRAFAENESLFGRNDDEVFSTQIVLWAFLAQVLRGGKGAACAAAVADIATYMQQTGGAVPCLDTGDYNLIRKLIATAAAVHGKQPRQLGFTLACQTVLSSWMLLATGACRDAKTLWKLALKRIAANEVANRPGRIEPRVIKRSRDHYPLMHDSRRKLRRRLPVT
jgi:hypothetical protein